MIPAALALLAFAAAPFGASGGDRPANVLVQLKPAAACSGPAELVRAGATVVAPELQLYRLTASRAEAATESLRARGALRTV